MEVNNPKILFLIATFFAGLPILIWLFLMLNKKTLKKATTLLIFLLGASTAPLLLGIQHLWEIYPAFNLPQKIEESFQNPTTAIILGLLLFAIIEEIIKFLVIVIVDKKTLLVQSVNDAMRYSIISALGFSFAENIYYLLEFTNQIATAKLLNLYLFRSIFTTCAHMIFSAIFGYFYGIGKFAIYLHDPKKDSKFNLHFWTEKIFNLAPSEAFKEITILKGLFLATLMHILYNITLQYDQILPVILAISISYGVLQYYLRRKREQVVLTNDISSAKNQQISKETEEIALELMEIWFKEKRFSDVAQIAERLLKRNPKNSNTKIILAQAKDALNNKQSLTNSIFSFFSEKTPNNDKSQLSKFKKIEKTTPENKKNLQDKVNKILEKGYYRLDI